MTLDELRERRLQRLKELRVVGSLTESGVMLEPRDGYELYKLAFFGNPLGVRKAKPDVLYQVPYILSFYESLYLIRKNVLQVIEKNTKVGEGRIKELARRLIEDFESKYLVYEDLRDRGYVVRPGMKYGSDFAVYIYGPGIDHAPFLVTVYSRNRKLRGIELIRAGRLASTVRKQWVIATIFNGRIEYYTFSWHKLKK